MKGNFGKIMFGLAVLGLAFVLTGCPISVGRTHNPGNPAGPPPPGLGWGDPGEVPVLLFIVRFDLNGGSGTIPTPLMWGSVANIPVILPNSAEFWRDGYSFEGWSMTATGIGFHAAGSEFIPTRDTTLFARWEPVGLPDPGNGEP